MKRNRLFTALSATAMMLLFASCSTDVEFAKDEHPYNGELTYTCSNKDIDTTYVTLCRIVRHGTYAMQTIFEDGATKKGRFMYNTPASAKGKSNLRSYELPIGEYIAHGVSCGYRDFNNNHVKTTRSGKGFDELNMEQRTFSHGSHSFQDKMGMEVATLDPLKDKNAYSTYVAPMTEPLYLLNSRMYKVPKNGSVKVPLEATKRSLSLKFNFNIEKNMKEEEFIITDIETELAGIPNKMDVISGYIDYSETFKVMYKTKFGTDSYTKKSLTCTGSVEVLSLLPPTNSSITVGPGILQIRIHVTTRSGIQRIIYGKLNLYNTMKKAKLVSFTDDNAFIYNNVKSATLSQSTTLKLSGKNIIKDIDDVSGIDVWQNIETEIVIKSED